MDGLLLLCIGAVTIPASLITVWLLIVLLQELSSRE